MFLFRWWLPIIAGMLAISQLLRFILAELFSIPIMYIPWVEMLGISFGLAILAFWLISRFKNQLSK
jgi:hypothetical protein